MSESMPKERAALGSAKRLLFPFYILDSRPVAKIPQNSQINKLYRVVGKSLLSPLNDTCAA